MQFPSLFLTLACVFASASAENLRASADQNLQGLYDLQEELNYELRQNGGRSLFFEQQLCNRINSAFSDNVSCDCTFTLANLKLGFACTAANPASLSGFEGLPKYEGGLDFDLIPPSVKVDASVELADVVFRDDPLGGSLKVGGGLCGGLGGVSFCGCSATVASITCPCVECDGGVSITCGANLPGVSDVCIPIPFVRTFRPSANSIPSYEA